MDYMSGNKKTNNHHLQNFPISAESLAGQMIEERGDVVFKNGAVYKGQWLGNMKHGFGV